MNSSLNIIASFTYPSASTSIMEMSADNQLLAFTVFNSLKIYNYTVVPFQLIRNVSFTSNITGLQVYSPYYAILSSANMIVQYDFEINKIISSSLLQTTFNQLIYKLGNNTLVVVKDLMISPYLDPYIYYYYWNTSYKCNSCVCSVTYRLDSSGN